VARAGYLLWSLRLTARYHRRFQSTLISWVTNSSSQGRLACLSLQYHQGAVPPSFPAFHLPACFLQLMCYPHKKKMLCLQPDGGLAGCTGPAVRLGKAARAAEREMEREAHPSQGQCRFGQLSGIISPQPCFHGCPATIASVFSHSLGPALLSHHKLH